jgi:hypothetical protein
MVRVRPLGVRQHPWRLLRCSRWPVNVSLGCMTLLYVLEQAENGRVPRFQHLSRGRLAPPLGDARVTGARARRAGSYGSATK